MNKFLATAPGSALRVFLSALLGSLSAWLLNGNTFDALSLATAQAWVGLAVATALPILIAWVNPADPRFGKGSG